MPVNAYYIEPKADDDAWGDHYGKVLLGPDDFACRLGEPEDCTWYRDGSEAMHRLNEQHGTIKKLKQEIEDQKETIKDLKADLGDAQKPKENWGDSEEERAWRRDAGGRG